jgi:hypothetical protein
MYATGWGQIFITGEPQHGENVAQNCRNELEIDSITDIWISLIDNIEEAPMNAEEIVDTFRQKNINMLPHLDENEFLSMTRGGKVF